MLTRPDPACAEVRRELAAFALRELSAADAWIVRRHVAGCSGCARAAAEVVAFVGGLREMGPAPRRAIRVLPAAAAAAIIAIAIVVVGARTSDVTAPPPSPRAFDPLPAEIRDLIAAQGPDGAWREDGTASQADPFTIGLSAMATLGCLANQANDPAVLGAARRGCDFLEQALAADRAASTPVSPDLRLRAHAAGAWALGSAARKWPERYRRSAIQAVRALGSLEEAAGGAGTASPSDLTAALVGTAYRAASSLGVWICRTMALRRTCRLPIA